MWRIACIVHSDVTHLDADPITECTIDLLFPQSSVDRMVLGERFSAALGLSLSGLSATCVYREQRMYAVEYGVCSDHAQDSGISEVMQKAHVHGGKLADLEPCAAPPGKLRAVVQNLWVYKPL